MSTRVTSQVTADGYQIVIASKRNWFLRIYLLVWVAGWPIGGVAAVRSLLHPDLGSRDLFMVLWLVFWAYAEVWVTYVWLWNAFGRELVTVRTGDLALRTEVLGYGRSQIFPVSQVSNLRARGAFGSAPYDWTGAPAFFGPSRGVVAFESGGKTHRFGLQLEEDEAQDVVAQLADHLSRQR